jgi:hypothetical protein
MGSRMSNKMLGLARQQIDEIEGSTQKSKVVDAFQKKAKHTKNNFFFSFVFSVKGFFPLFFFQDVFDLFNLA